MPRIQLTTNKSVDELPLPKAYDAERAVCALFYDKQVTVHLTGQYERRFVLLPTKGGSKKVVAVSRHADPLVEAFRWLICEGTVIQNLWRLRMVHPNAREGRPRIYIIANVPTLPVDRVEPYREIVQLQGMGRICEGVEILGGMLPLDWPWIEADGRLLNLFPTKNAVDTARRIVSNQLTGGLYINIYNGVPLIRYWYRQTGRAGAKPTVAVGYDDVDAANMWLHECVGEVNGLLADTWAEDDRQFLEIPQMIEDDMLLAEELPAYWIPRWTPFFSIQHNLNE